MFRKHAAELLRRHQLQLSTCHLFRDLKGQLLQTYKTANRRLTEEWNKHLGHDQFGVHSV